MTAGGGAGCEMGPGCCAFGRMGWAGATPLLVCISTEEKAFKPKKLEDFFKIITLSKVQDYLN